MMECARIGLQIVPSDQFWVLVREAVYAYARELSIELVPIDDERLLSAPYAEQVRMIGQLRGLGLRALICAQLAERVVEQFLAQGVAVVSLDELELRHPRLSSAESLFHVAELAGSYVRGQLPAGGHVALVGGGDGCQPGQRTGGESRVAGLRAVLEAPPAFRVTHIPCGWDRGEAQKAVQAALTRCVAPFDALVGLSDSLALGGRDALGGGRHARPNLLVVGINGDPLAVAEVIAGRMAATVATPPAALGRQAVDLAWQAAQRRPLPPTYAVPHQLVTPQNAAGVAAEQLVAIADLPTRLIGVNREHERQRMTQLETCLSLTRHVGVILDREALAAEIVALIRANYGFDAVHLYYWDAAGAQLTLEQPHTTVRTALLPPLPTPFAEALGANRSVVVAEDLPAGTGGRVVVPIRLGGTVVGLLDMLHRTDLPMTRIALDGLQLIADQFGIALRNAELYGEAVTARQQAELADQLKTRLLANVSHELRTPLHIILGYSQLAADESGAYAAAPATVRQDMSQIHRSGEHLLRLINDLLDLSRAEVDALALYPEPIDLVDLLGSTLSASGAGLGEAGITWQLDLPARLPALTADPVRLRQILLNLLANAAEHAGAGQIRLSAAVEPPYVAVRVHDTGPGVPAELHEAIFRPFVSEGTARSSRRGVGLGLAIARRLAMLHGGDLELERSDAQGSVFCLRLPLPSLERPQALMADANAIWQLGACLDPSVVAVGERSALPIRTIATLAELDAARAISSPALIVWSMDGAPASEWEIVQRIQSDSVLAQRPFLLYSPAHPVATAFGPKPLSGGGLLALIAAARPASNGCVLVAEDDPVARALYQQVIAEALPECRAVCVPDGRAALDWLAEQTPALVLLDLMMPVVDGFGVLEAMRADARLRTTPVIILSGRVLDLEDIDRLGGATFRPKLTLTKGEIGTALRHALGGAGTGAATSALVKRAITYIQHHYADDFSRQQLAAAAGVSETYLTQIFQRELGLAPWVFLNRYRIGVACELLRREQVSVSAVASQVGFNDPAYFARMFHRVMGCSPRAYRVRPAEA